MWKCVQNVNLNNLQNNSFFQETMMYFLLMKILLNKYSCQKTEGIFGEKTKNSIKILKKLRPR